MRIRLKQAVHLGGKDYSRGVHEIPDQVLKSKFFLKLAELGLAEDGEAAKVVSSESIQDRQKRLAEKLAATPKETAPAQSQSLGPSDVLPEDPMPSAEPSEEEKTLEAAALAEPKSKDKKANKKKA